MCPWSGVRLVAGERIHRVSGGVSLTLWIGGPGAAGAFVAEAVDAVVATAFFGLDVAAGDVVAREQVVFGEGSAVAAGTAN